MKLADFTRFAQCQFADYGYRQALRRGKSYVIVYQIANNDCFYKAVYWDQVVWC